MLLYITIASILHSLPYNVFFFFFLLTVFHILIYTSFLSQCAKTHKPTLEIENQYTFATTNLMKCNPIIIHLIHSYYVLSCTSFAHVMLAACSFLAPQLFSSFVHTANHFYHTMNEYQFQHRWFNANEFLINIRCLQNYNIESVIKNSQS